MGIPPRELGSRLSAAELTEFIGYSLIEPFGPQRDDDRARGIMGMSAIAGGIKADPSEFLETWKPEPDRSPADDAGIFQAQVDALTMSKES